MMKVDLFAFGGGFASVPLMFQEVVTARNWLPANVFMDGIVLGQLTPGPIVITATFVGHQMAGVLGAVAATLCIFSPSLFLLLLVEPWFSRFSASPVFKGAAHALVLSFVGLLASVTVHFAEITTWSLSSVLLATAALLALLFKIEVVWVVLVGALASTFLM